MTGRFTAPRKSRPGGTQPPRKIIPFPQPKIPAPPPPFWSKFRFDWSDLVYLGAAIVILLMFVLERG